MDKDGNDVVAGRGKAWDILKDYYVYDDKPTDEEPPTPIRLPLKDDGYIVGVSTEKEAGRGEWANPPIIEYGEPLVMADEVVTGDFLIHENEPKVFSEADLLRLAGQLEAAMEQGWVFKRYARCGVSEHRHRWALTASLCEWLTRSLS